MKSEERRGAPFYGEDAPNWSFAWIVKATIGRLLLAVYRTRVIGIENVPEGPCIISGNHVSYLDPAFLWCFNLPRQPHFVAKADLYKFKWGSWFLDMFGAMPVNRNTADRVMITRTTKLLARGECIGIFPEGTRVRDIGPDELGEAADGVSFIAMRAGVPVVPVGIAGTDKIRPEGSWMLHFPRVTYRFGKPIYPESFEGDKKERLAKMTDAIMKSIQEERALARQA